MSHPRLNAGRGVLLCVHSSFCSARGNIAGFELWNLVGIVSTRKPGFNFLSQRAPPQPFCVVVSHAEEHKDKNSLPKVYGCT